jgi:hypothetical protein
MAILEKEKLIKFYYKFGNQLHWSLGLQMARLFRNTVFLGTPFQVAPSSGNSGIIKLTKYKSDTRSQNYNRIRIPLHYGKYELN